MGSVGDAYDNAMAESFFSTLEAELLSRRRFASCVFRGKSAADSGMKSATDSDLMSATPI
jgi:hypothetical protein